MQRESLNTPGYVSSYSDSADSLVVFESSGAGIVRTRSKLNEAKGSGWLLSPDAMFSARVSRKVPRDRRKE